MRDFLKEPLLHFLALGLGLFALFEFAADDEDSYDPRTITVSEESLLAFLQYRSRAFEPTVALARLRNMPTVDLQRLIDDYVTEEALYREAVSLGLEKNDYIIKRRMVQSIEFITTGFVTENVQVSEEDVLAHYESNLEDYGTKALITFTHVFFSSEKHGRNEAAILAEAKLDELNSQGVRFDAAARHGDFFPYTANYVEKDVAFIGGQLGQSMAEALFSLAPDKTQWRGPIESPLGFHLVLMPERVESRVPPLEEIAGRVRYDAEQAAATKMKAKVVQGIIDKYKVSNELSFDSEAASE